MRFVPEYRIYYGGRFYEAGQAFQIDEKDADEMRQHGTVVADPAPPIIPAQKRAGRPRRSEHGQSGKTETENRRAGRSNP